VGRTFQETKVFANMVVLQNVLVGAFFGSPNRVSAADAAREATQALEFVGLSAMSTAPVKDLTLVNQKRVEVARALATKPELLLLDELMAGLNPTEISEAMELVTKIRDKGITIFMVEHVMKAIMGICERITVLHHGEKICEGTPQEIACNKQVIEIYLGKETRAGS
jgi:branched-chain amino acid transport system ATP-binding protein